MFLTAQFLRAIEHGSISILKDDIRTGVIDAYRVMGSANTKIQAIWLQEYGRGTHEAHTAARKLIIESRLKIDIAQKCLLEFLGSEKEQ